MFKLTRILLLGSMFFALNIQAQNLVSVTPLGVKTKAQLLAQFDNLPFIQYGAKYYRIAYTSVDVHGALDTVTGLLSVPDNAGKVYPRLVYQHGTSGSKTDVPSLNYNGGEGQVGLLFAGLGYVALLPDYLGLGNESRGFHPYVHAESEAWVAIDMLRAGAVFCEQNQVATNNQLFITGYSQGGHAAMALQRAIETDEDMEFAVTAAAHLSGPYSISGVMRDLILSDDIYYYPAYIPNTALSYQTVYGNLFNQVSDMFRAPYAALIQSFYVGDITLSALNEALINALIDNEGACRPFRMLQPNLVQAIINEPNHPINQALADNDTYNNWTPVSPTRIFYCMEDDQVPFENSILARDSLSPIALADFQVQDVMPSADHGECYVPAVTGTLFFFLGFQQVGMVNTNTPEMSLRLNVAPNPASESLEVTNLTGAGLLEILDLNGKSQLSVQIQGAGTQKLTISHLPPGFYAVRFSGQDRQQLGKLLIQK